MDFVTFNIGKGQDGLYYVNDLTMFMFSFRIVEGEDRTVDGMADSRLCFP